MPLKRIVLFGLVIFGPLLSGAAIAASSSTPLPDGSTLDLAIPSTWQSDHEVAGPGLTLRLSSADSGRFVVLMTVLPVKAGSPASTPEGLRASVVEQGNRSLPTSLQDRLELSEVRGEQGVGYLYHLTDRNEEKGPGDYREATQGAMLLGRHLVTITILTHTGDSATVEQARQVVASAKITPHP